MEGKKSDASDRGTRLHAEMERHLLTHTRMPLAELKTIPAIAVLDLPEEDNHDLNLCIDYLVAVINSLPAEERFDVGLKIEFPSSMEGFNKILHLVSGTADIVIVTPKRMIVIDWKFGKGVFVSVNDNDQLRAYAAGAAQDYRTLHGFDCIEIHVCQPALDNYNAEVLSPEEMTDWIEYRVIPGVMAAEKPGAARIPGEYQCQFCPGKMSCPERNDQSTRNAMAVFQSHVVLTHTPDLMQLSTLLQSAKELKRRIAEVEKYAFALLASGKPFPGFKLVEGRANREWSVPEQEVVETLLNMGADDGSVFETKLVSPAKAEKIGKGFKKALQPLIRKGKPSFSLVPEDDPREPAEVNTAEQVFADYIESEE
jgi:hypothetical protein